MAKRSTPDVVIRLFRQQNKGKWFPAVPSLACGCSPGYPYQWALVFTHICSGTGQSSCRWDGRVARTKSWFPPRKVLFRNPRLSTISMCLLLSLLLPFWSYLVYLCDSLPSRSASFLSCVAFLILRFLSYLFGLTFSYGPSLETCIVSLIRFQHAQVPGCKYCRRLNETRLTEYDLSLRIQVPLLALARQRASC